MSEQLAINGGPKTVTNSLLGWPQFDENAIKAVEKVLRSGKVNYWTGPLGMEFEKIAPPNFLIVKKLTKGDWADYSKIGNKRPPSI